MARVRATACSTYGSRPRRATWPQVGPSQRDAGRGIRFYGWAYTSRHLLYIQDVNGDENWRLYAVDLDRTR